MAHDSQSRKWQITINNPTEKGYDHEKIKEELSKFKAITYYCMADEVSKTHHTHIFVVFASAVRFSTLKKRFPEAHFEMARGTAQQNRDYIAKSGKWENDKKHGTVIAGTFEEIGEIPVERQGARTDLEDLYDRIKAGASNYEIMEEAPEYLFHIDKIERARQAIRAESYKETFREMRVTYIWGGQARERHDLSWKSTAIVKCTESLITPIPSMVTLEKTLLFLMNIDHNSGKVICSTISTVTPWRYHAAIQTSKPAILRHTSSLMHALNLNTHRYSLSNPQHGLPSGGVFIMFSSLGARIRAKLEDLIRELVL